MFPIDLITPANIEDICTKLAAIGARMSIRIGSLPVDTIAVLQHLETIGATPSVMDIQNIIAQWCLMDRRMSAVETTKNMLMHHGADILDWGRSEFYWVHLKELYPGETKKPQEILKEAIIGVIGEAKFAYMRTTWDNFEQQAYATYRRIVKEVFDIEDYPKADNCDGLAYVLLRSMIRESVPKMAVLAYDLITLATKEKLSFNGDVNIDLDSIIAKCDPGMTQMWHEEEYSDPCQYYEVDH